MGNKLYEEASVKDIGIAIKKKIKEAYRYTNKGLSGEEYDVSSEAKKWYEHNYKIADMGPNLNPGGSVDPERNSMGILNFNSHLGFPEDVKYAGSSSVFSPITASGKAFVAPENGWVAGYVAATAGRWAQFTNNSSNMICRGQCMTAAGGSYYGSVSETSYNYPIYLLMPCARYDRVTVSYSTIPTLSYICARKTNTKKIDSDVYDPYTEKHCFPPIQKISATANINNSGTTNRFVAEDFGWLVYVGTSSSHYAVISHAGYYKNFVSLSNMGTWVSGANGMVVSTYGSAVSSPYCFFPMAKGSAVSISRLGGNFYFIKAHS